MSDEYISVDENEMTLEEYPCGLNAGTYIAPIKDIIVDNNVYLYKNDKCLVLTGNPKEPNTVWFRICKTSEVATWDETILNDFQVTDAPFVTQNELLNKRILIGITKFDRDDNILERTSHWGAVTKVAENTVYIHDESTDEEFSIPYDAENFHESDPNLQFSTLDDKQKIENINYISRWNIYASIEDEED